MANRKYKATADRILIECRRWRILSLLCESRTNEDVLKRVLIAEAYPTSTDRLRTDLAWLEEQGLITVDIGENGYMVLTVRARGADVARGLAKVPGVASPPSDYLPEV